MRYSLVFDELNITLMPLGVEHATCLEYSQAFESLNITLMPLGVEHLEWREFLHELTLLNITLMPLGVEHILRFLLEETQSAEYNFDAARR